MKSIVEQASTVLKAIEKGWIQAGKPGEFTVKVYEHGVKNFFGMSVEPAKICILFEDKASKATTQKQYSRQDVSTSHQPHQEPINQRKQVTLPKLSPTQKNFSETSKEIQQHTRPVSTKVIWNNELIDACKQWLISTLAIMGKDNCTFNLEAKKYHLIITFSQPIFEDKEREKALFRSFAHLLMQSLRNHFKKGLRGYRIVLNASQH